MPKPVQVPGRNGSPERGHPRPDLAVSGAAVETVPPRPRRSFSAAEKVRIVKEAAACLASGERGAIERLLRHEGIYSSLLSSWRVQLGMHGTAGLEARKAGRKPKLDAKDRRIAELVKLNARLERKLELAEKLVALQKKAHEILGLALPEITEET